MLRLFQHFFVFVDKHAEEKQKKACGTPRRRSGWRPHLFLLTNPSCRQDALRFFLISSAAVFAWPDGAYVGEFLDILFISKFRYELIKKLQRHSFGGEKFIFD
ncbi:hypothetical protein QFZ25_003905 [Bacillus atrophaeus]|nr:hypothetical protein [Bacillus atrophaeus]